MSGFNGPLYDLRLQVATPLVLFLVPLFSSYHQEQVSRIELLMFVETYATYAGLIIFAACLLQYTLVTLFCELWGDTGRLLVLVFTMAMEYSALGAHGSYIACSTRILSAGLFSLKCQR